MTAANSGRGGSKGTRLEPRLDAEAIARNMAEIDPPFSAQEARVEAGRCLFCFDAPCIHACPTGIDVPAFIRKIAHGNLVGSARTILEANILGASCARSCPTEVLCEGACVLLDRDHQPIQIGRLQRHATDPVLASESGFDAFLPAKSPDSGKRVALLGSGPASLGCAAELARLGHHAVIYERQARPGGLNTHGIAYYKLRSEVSLREVALVESLGVEVRSHTEVVCSGEVDPAAEEPGGCERVSIDDVRAGHDALFIGVGLGGTRSLGIPGEELMGVREALSFIRDIRSDALDRIPIGRRVVVVGCGNTAIDVATQAKRLGAEQVTIVYRRGERDMSAFDFEYQLAKADGVEFVFHVVPTEILGPQQVSGVRLRGTNLATDGPAESELACDMVIEALGQVRLEEMLSKLLPGIAFHDGGVLERDFDTGRTSLSGVFAGGDCANGGREVVDAVAEGKRAARGIHQFFGGDPVPGTVQPSRLGASGKISGAGFDAPLRVLELEARYNADRDGDDVRNSGEQDRG